jgi:hypothetical protein
MKMALHYQFFAILASCCLYFVFNGDLAIRCCFQTFSPKKHERWLLVCTALGPLAFKKAGHYHHLLDVKIAVGGSFCIFLLPILAKTLLKNQQS